MNRPPMQTQMNPRPWDAIPSLGNFASQERRTPMTGAEELRACVAWCNSSNDSALDEFTAAELVQCFRAYRLSGWDLVLSDWTPEQRRAAARKGIVPRWDMSSEEPITGIHWTTLPRRNPRT